MFIFRHQGGRQNIQHVPPFLKLAMDNLEDHVPLPVNLVMLVLGVPKAVALFLCQDPLAVDALVLRRE